MHNIALLVDRPSNTTVPECLTFPYFFTVNTVTYTQEFQK